MDTSYSMSCSQPLPRLCVFWNVHYFSGPTRAEKVSGWSQFTRNSNTAAYNDDQLSTIFRWSMGSLMINIAAQWRSLLSPQLYLIVTCHNGTNLKDAETVYSALAPTNHSWFSAQGTNGRNPSIWNHELSRKVAMASVTLNFRYNLVLGSPLVSQSWARTMAARQKLAIWYLHLGLVMPCVRKKEDFLDPHLQPAFLLVYKQLTLVVQDNDNTI